MTITKTGIIKYIAATKGLIFEEEPAIWHNPNLGCKNKIKVKTKLKGNLSYASLGEIQSKIKEIHPNATFLVHEQNGFPYISDKTGAYVEVAVKINDIIYTLSLPVMDFKNYQRINNSNDSN